VFGTPELVTSLAKYSETKQPTEESTKKALPQTSEEHELLQSRLFLQVFTAADYYTMNTTLMEHVPPVLVDIILDPYILNVFPQSLVPTGIYLVILAIGSWYISGVVSKWLQNIAHQDIRRKEA
jgi:hypothetical protein